MSRRDEDRAFLEDQAKIQSIAERARDKVEGRIRERVESRLSMPAIEAAIDEGLARREALSGRGGASLWENIAFLAFAAVVLAIQTVVLLRLRPAVFLGLEAGLNWLAPFVFYVIFRLDRRAVRRREEARR